MVGEWLAACGEARLETASEPALSPGGGAGGGESSSVTEHRAGADVDGGGPALSPSASGSTGIGEENGGLGSTGGEQAGGAPPIPREPLVTLSDFDAAYMVGPIDAETFQVADQPFTDAWRATMSEAPENHWAAQLVVPLDKTVAAGELLHVSFWVRCEKAGDTGDCLTAFIFERASDPWEKSVTFPVHADGTWQQKSEFFSAVDSYEADSAHMVFRLGYALQTIAIGGIEVESIGSAP